MGDGKLEEEMQLESGSRFCIRGVPDCWLPRGGLTGERSKYICAAGIGGEFAIIECGRRPCNR
jgi:hypothetical protein